MNLSFTRNTALFLLFVSANVFSFAQNYSEDDQRALDSLNLLITTKTSHDTSKAGAYIGLTEILYVTNLDTMIPLCRKALVLIDAGLKNNPNGVVKRTFIELKAAAFNNIGYVHSEKGDNDSGVFYYNESLRYAEEAGDKATLAYGYNNLAGVYREEGNVPLTLEYYMKSMNLMEEIGDQKGKAMSLNNIGLIYREQGDYEQALSYYEQSLAIKEKEDDRKGIANTLHNIAAIYSLQGDTARAFEFNLKSLGIRQELGDKKGIALSMTNIGEMYLSRDMLDSARWYFAESLALREQIGNKEGIALSNVSLGDTYRAMGKNALARKHAAKAYEVAKELENPSLIARSASLLKNILYDAGQYKEAFDLYREEMQMEQLLVNEENYKKIQQEQARYEYEMKHTADSVAFAKQQELDQLEIARRDAENEAQLATKRTQQYILVGGFIVVILFAFFFYNRFRVTNRQKAIIESQKEEAETQKEIIETKHKEITDSINYAKRIQTAILPSQRTVDQLLPDSFIYYKPKDIVAGDFYWLEERNGLIYFAAADCTGHGVPGAMVSVICNNGLNRSLREYGIGNPGKILDKTRELVIAEFEKSDENVRDGMDISLAVLDPKTMKLNWAGANNPLWVIRKGVVSGQSNTPEQGIKIETLNGYSLLELKPDKQPIGKYSDMKPFTTHQLDLKKGDTLYLFTDGFQDQFGGDKGKKFKASNLKSALLQSQEMNLAQQRHALSESFDAWKGSLEQVDDVCVICVRI